MQSSTQQLAVYRKLNTFQSATAQKEGRDVYWIAPAGLEPRDAEAQRISPFYVDQITALAEMMGDV